MKEKEFGVNSNIVNANTKSMITNVNTSTTGNQNAPNERKLSDGMEIQTISKEESSKNEEGIVENQEYVLTKMAISKLIFLIISRSTTSNGKNEIIILFHYTVYPCGTIIKSNLF